MFARREEERAALSRHAGPLWQMGFRSRKKEEHVSRKETSGGSVNICVSHLGTNLGRHKIGTRQHHGPTITAWELNRNGNHPK